MDETDGTCLVWIIHCLQTCTYLILIHFESRLPSHHLTEILWTVFTCEMWKFFGCLIPFWLNICGQLNGRDDEKCDDDIFYQSSDFGFNEKGRRKKIEIISLKLFSPISFDIKTRIITFTFTTRPFDGKWMETRNWVIQQIRSISQNEREKVLIQFSSVWTRRERSFSWVELESDCCNMWNLSHKLSYSHWDLFFGADVSAPRSTDFTGDVVMPSRANWEPRHNFNCFTIINNLIIPSGRCWILSRLLMLLEFWRKKQLSLHFEQS